MSRLDVRSWALALVAILSAALFVRLGVWQIERLVERREGNVERSARAAAPPLELSAAEHLPSADSLAGRRVRLTGTWDFEHEIVIRGRAALGSPGVHVATPLRISDGAAILVLRGWLPAADGLSGDLAAARPAPGDSARTVPGHVTGLARRGEAAAAIPPRWSRFETGEQLVLGSMDMEEARRGLGIPLLDVWILPDSSVHAGGEVEPRLVEAPVLSSGPHLMYAIQWFGFAAIAVAGAAVYLANRPGKQERGTT